MIDFKEAAIGLKELLGLRNEPVAVTFTNEEVEVAGSGRVWICRALQQASEGRSFAIDAENSACPGGSWHCGLTEPVSGPALRGLQHFLTRGEKLTASIVSFERMRMLSTPPPTGLSERILITPMREAELRPDLVVFLCDPEQACRLIWLDTYWDGVPPRVELLGSLCHSAIAYPLVTGSSNLTLGDWTARRMQGFSADTVFFTLPLERMHNLLEAVPRSSAGRAEVEMPPGFHARSDD